jgi:hypothetical protein
MAVVRVKPGCSFRTIAPAGFVILSTLKAITRELSFDVTITSACDGAHPAGDGAQSLDPHYTGEAYDLRTHDLTPLQKGQLLTTLITRLGDRFYAFLEAPGTGNEHIHVQRRRGTLYTVLDYLAA